MATFLFQHIIYRFGILDVIITNNGTSFFNPYVSEICNKFHIAHRIYTSYHPQANGQVEAFNKILANILAKTIITSHRNWHSHLFSTLWAYRTSIRNAICITPFSLIYGFKVVLLLEVEIPSLHVSLKEFTDEQF